ncbi:MAG: hypothetical protein M0P97_02855 [Candidatus Moranbacteria bacterium]|nr:hypothetical protein [Candidatus Moranbacteria bacterium]
MKKGYDFVCGVKLSKRVIWVEILNELALWIIEGKIEERAVVNVKLAKGRIIFQ